MVWKLYTDGFNFIEEHGKSSAVRADGGRGVGGQRSEEIVLKSM